ncbi:MULTISPECIES: Lrp/AsnC family transcriptional regulator [Actinoplanes]|uniref:Lrp/AsnC family transcriptional regulator n=1 Tax=Actinoplanes TaxID=1865 RepID=UPI0005F2C434|nr:MULTISPECIES: Lrp/AsnC family transcriptional regulator [Actinoplanes]GLY06730.1 AsnC family transcriptional regulator [Actinoplanes sp. NBRC 101535]
MEIDTLDEQIVHALRINGRAGYREIGAVLGVSDQTVARRYRRLREKAGVRVVGLPDSHKLGHEVWTLRLHTTTDAAVPLSRALARRPDTAWVTINSGGTEISCNVRVPETADRDALLLNRLPRTKGLVSVDAYCVIHQYVGGSVGDRHDTAMTAEQIAAMTPPPHPGGRPARLGGADDSDAALFTALRSDGRMGLADLATATGWPESTVRRRLQELTASRDLFFDVEVSAELFGYRAVVQLWLSVVPARLAAVGAAMAEHEEVVFAAACTGPTNLIATVVCTDMSAFYRYVTESVGPLAGVERLESAPVVRHVKQLGTVG